MFFNNKIYLPIYQNGMIIIYDMNTDKTFYLNTHLNKIHSILHIDNNNIIISSSLSIHIYNYNIMGENINIISKKEIYFGSIINDVYYLNNNIIFRNRYNKICLHNLGRYVLKFPSNELGYYYNHIYLYNNSLYMFDSNICLIEIINFGAEKQTKIITLYHENSNSIMFQEVSSFIVDETYFYIKCSEHINIFDHNGEFIGNIKIDGVKLNESFYVDSKFIYMTQIFEKIINLLVFKHNIEYTDFEKNNLINNFFWNKYIIFDLQIFKSRKN